ncbi:MAG: 1-acyl-sn-glycerol-3-phosphate acyltransferase [Gammaproteobacteria bacterium]|nr:1-acyl-sn-glycerol-3-phosphate acyltransferase [Gammaproteobacteria bacterium]
MIQWLRSLLFLAFGFLSVIVYAVVVMLMFWAPKSWLHALVVHYCNLALWAGDFFCGMKVVVEGQENIPEEPSVIMIKHTTALETYGHVPFFPTTAWVVKRELTWAPIFGWAIGLVLEPIAIKRSARSNAVKQVIRQGKKKLANGVWVTIFPEGTRMPPGETRKYGVSGAALAQEANVMIVPVAHNAGDFWPRLVFTKRPGLVRFCIGPPISAQGRTPRETNLVVQEWIENKMLEISSTYQEQQKTE